MRPPPSTQHQYPVTPHTRRKLKCHLEASGAGWASDGCCSCRQTSHCQRASPWTNAGQCGTDTGLSSGGSVDSGYLCPERFPGKRGTGQFHLTSHQVQFSSRHPTTHSSPWPHRQPYFSLKELQAGQELAPGSLGSRTAGDKNSHAAKGHARSQAFLTSKSGQQGEVTSLQTSPSL